MTTPTPRRRPTRRHLDSPPRRRLALTALGSLLTLGLTAALTPAPATAAPAVAVATSTVGALGTAPTVVPVPTPGATQPVAPVRVLDTRNAMGVTTRTPVAPGGVVTVKVTGMGGVPTTGVASVAVNLTVTSTLAGGFLTGYASGAPRPNVSNLNWLRGQTVANHAVLPVGADGRVALRNSSAGGTHVILDLAGYVLSGTPAAAGAFHTTTPTRVLDTRNAYGIPTTTPVRAGGTASVKVTGTAGLPSTGVSAVAVNLTVTEPSAAGYLTAHANGTATPTASNLNWLAHQTLANHAVVPVGADGRIALTTNAAGGTAHVVVDVAGYFLGGTPGLVGTFAAMDPTRVLDTRHAQGVPGTTPLAGGGTVTTKVTGTAGIPAIGVSAVAVNLTVTGTASSGYLTGFASQTPRPNASNLNWLRSQTIANHALLPVGADGRIAIYNGSRGATHVVVDIAGYVLGDIPTPVTVTPLDLPSDALAGGDAGPTVESTDCSPDGVCAVVGTYPVTSGDRGFLAYDQGAGFSTQRVEVGTTYDSVTCTGALCVALGTLGDGSAVLSSTSTGTWTTVPATPPSAPAPAAAAPARTVAVTSELGSVSCPSVRSCYALGTYDTGSAAGFLVVGFDGSRWTSSAIPYPAGTTKGHVSDLSCTTAGLCAGVGSVLDGAGLPAAVVLSRTGGVWGVGLAPVPAGAQPTKGSRLTRVACTGTGCTAAGTLPDATHPDGTYVVSGGPGSWVARFASEEKSATGSAVAGLACATATDCTVVGSVFQDVASTFSQSARLYGVVGGVPAPVSLSPGGLPSDWDSELTDVDCLDASACYAVGSYLAKDGSAGRGVIATRARGAWSMVQAPVPNGAAAGPDGLDSVACGARTCVAFGHYQRLATGGTSVPAVSVLRIAG